MNTLEQKMNDAIWIAKELFDRGKATGSSANLSFLHDGHIYITGSGTCFGNLTTESSQKYLSRGSTLQGSIQVKNFLFINYTTKNRKKSRQSFMSTVFMLPFFPFWTTRTKLTLFRIIHLI